MDWGDEWLRLLRPPSDERIYANYQTYETRAGSPSVFGPNHRRLLALKNRYAPANFFRRNANIAAPNAPVPSGAHFFFQAEDGIRALYVTGVQTCALPI